MRPVNLIPGDERRGRHAASGRNKAPFVVIGALVLVLCAVSAIAVFDKHASDKQTEVDALEAQVQSAQAEAASFDSFTSFQQLHDARLATIDSLAKSRFDWERVMRELSIVIPDDVFLTNLTGTVTPAVSVTNGAGLSLRGSIPGPALELVGCARNQRTVARLIAAMDDIDGIGRVVVSNSSKADPTEKSDATDDTGAPAGGSSGSDVAGCSARPNYPTFQLVAAFDGVPVTADPAAVPPTGTPVSATPTDPAAATTPPAAASTTTATPAATTTSTTTSTTDGGAAAASDSSSQQQTEIAAAQQAATNAAQIPSGGGK